MERLSHYDYDLPEDLIAQSPLEDRAASRLLVLYKNSGKIEHREFREVPTLFESGDLLILNDTRVSGLRLLGRRVTGGAVEALVIQEEAPGCFLAMTKPAKRLRQDTHLTFEGLPPAVVVEDRGEGLKVLQFDASPDLRARLEEVGETPLPPYIHKRLGDRERYQTVYGTVQGSAAAPTAGLHFTHEVLRALEQRGVGIAKVTLHVGIDTFRPVQSDVLDEHKMHGERCEVSLENARKIATCKGRRIAVGTTTVRTLETFGEALLSPSSDLSTTSRLFIRPGFEFKVVDGMFTNFHLPRTTMLMMISALAGITNVRTAYQEAIADRYRFLSFGDSMVIL